MKLVQYVDHMGSDDAVCDAARVSMNKSSDLFSVSSNNNLIRYLAEHNHWSPFSHCVVKMRFTAPIFIARQLQKHQVGFSWNEVSRRYVSDTPKMWYPDYLRPVAPSVKQGSTDVKHVASDLLMTEYEETVQKGLNVYNNLIDLGVCPEQARAVLPQAAMTEWIWTGSLYGWARMYNLRSEASAQKEVREYAAEVHAICNKYFPISWRELTRGENS